MKFIDFLNKFLKKQSKEMVTLRQTITVKKREELDALEIEKLEDYKNEYINLLNNRVIFSQNLELVNIKDDIFMYVELISKLFTNENDISFVNVNDDILEIEKINLFVKSNKMIMYLQNLIDLENQTELMVLALEEILNENKFGFIKKRAIFNKIENLSSNIWSFKSQIQAIVLEVRACLTDIKTNYNLDNLNENLLKEKEDLLKYMFKLVYPLELVYHKNMEFNSIYESIAYLEKRLEVLTYKHKDVINELNKEISNINFKYEDKIEKFKELETKMRIFSEYGKNIVTKEMLVNLYTLKFNILTENIIKSYDKNTLMEMNYAEIECYENIIMGKINKILMRENYNFTTSLREYTNDGIKIFEKILKNENNEYSFYDILMNHEKLAFLISFDNIKYNFFEDFMVNIKEHNKIIYEEPILLWEDNLPLETVCEIAICEGKEHVNPLYEFYSLKRKVITKYNVNEMWLPNLIYYMLPKGLEEIRIKEFNLNGILGNLDKYPILKFIREKCKDRNVFFPESLKRVYGDFLFGINIKSLHLNEGLKELNSFTIPENVEELSMPISLEYIESTAFVRDYINIKERDRFNMTVHDYKNIKNIIFNYKEFTNENVMKLMNILKYFFYIDFIPEVFNNLDYNISVDTISIFPDEMYYKIKCKLDSITFKNYGKNSFDITINKSELNNYLVTRSSSYVSNRLDYSELEELIYRLKKLVNSKIVEESNTKKLKR